MMGEWEEGRKWEFLVKNNNKRAGLPRYRAEEATNEAIILHLSQYRKHGNIIIYVYIIL